MTTLDSRVLARGRLDNGMTVTVERRRLTPAVALNIWYRVGSQHEQPGRTGLAHLFEHLMFEGSEHVANGEHFGALDPLGASVNATTSFERTNYFEVVPVGALDLALWLEADRLATLPHSVDQDNLENQRAVVKNERRQVMDNVPYGTAFERLLTALFPAGHPYHHLPIGSMDDLDAASLADVREFFARFYRPANGYLSIVGDVDPDQALARVEHYFGGIGNDSEVALAFPEPPAELPPLSDAAREVVVDEPVPTEHIWRAWRAPADGDPQADAVGLALSILSDGPASRLHHRLIRTENLARPGLSGSLERLPDGNSAAFLGVPLPEGGDLVKCEAILDEEITRLCERGPTERELLAAQAKFEHTHLRAMASLDGRADELSHHACLWDDPGGADRVVGRVKSVDAGAVAEAAARWLRPDSSATLIYELEGNDR